MKRIVLFFAFAITMVSTLSAQETGNIVLFTANGEQFTAILNGMQMNPQPETNLKIQDLNQPAYKLKVIFANRALGEMDKTLYTKPGYEVVMSIKQNKKGEYKLGYVSEAPLNQLPPAPANQSVVVYNTALPPATTTTTTVVEETQVVTTGGGTTTTTGVSTPTGENVSMNVNIDGFGMGVNITTSETNMGTNMNTNMGTSSMSTTTTTTTTTTTSGGWVDDQVVVADPTMTGTPCYEMGSSDFESAKRSIESKTFRDSKLTQAKQITQNNCLSSSQVLQIAKLMAFEDDKLDYAKFAYSYVMDRNNYYKVNDAFTFEASIDELDQYINSTR
ncbi:MAG: DUF4476 domain-containing protein [Bacteroidia bacterium]|nr:DUF4476 domain-containing protein [Bacteroidia bacterium]